MTGGKCTSRKLERLTREMPGIGGALEFARVLPVLQTSVKRRGWESLEPRTVRHRATYALIVGLDTAERADQLHN